MTGRGLLFTVALLAPCGFANAGVFYTSFSGSNVYAQGWAVSASIPQSLAEVFQASVTGILASIDLAVVMNSGTNSFIVDLVNDNSGAPGGTLIEAFTLSNISTTTVTIETVTSILNPVLSANTNYWLEVFPGAADTEGGWYYDQDNALGLWANFGSDWNDFSDFASPSFQINSADAPEPASGLLLLSAGLLMAGICVTPRLSRCPLMRRA
jgi:hypothetical protein